MDKELEKAIIDGNLDGVKEILVYSPEKADKEGFFLAAKLGNFDIVRYYVEYSRLSLNEYDDDHRNALHYAALSGNKELFIYLVDKCGMDPTAGDNNLVTSWDIVREQLHETDNKEIDGTGNAPDFAGIEEYLENKYGHKYEDFYKNPIRRGFFPDPSICRVGSDYYMVNSSFIFFPCIPISHSRDLIHWEIIGHAITDPNCAGIDDLEGGRGYWAPDISYYEGKFYITATLRLNDKPPVYRRQIIVSSERPEGPYSEPVYIDEDGIDPSLFNDDDGKRYMLLNRGARILELDKTATKQISEAKLLYYGDHKRAPEGPHLFKKDGYYYLLEAEGGTGDGHRVTVSRSKTLFGNYETCPYNPIMRQKDEGAIIQRCGHGDMVETNDGRWFMVYLCGRKIDNKYSMLGRETAIDPVTWTSDGWPIVNDLKGPSYMQVKPYPDMDGSEDADVPKAKEILPFDYTTPRTFFEGNINYLEEDGHRVFDIRGCKYPLSSVQSRNIVLRRQSSFKFKYSVTLEIPELSDGQNAGITGYYDENTFICFGIKNVEGSNYVYALEHCGEALSEKVSKEPLPTEAKEISFTMTTDYLQRVLSYTVFGKENTFTRLSDVYYLCDEGLKMGKRFTGAMVGMYCYGGPLQNVVARFTDPVYEDVG
ncbi:family 43 glycosylhydrolase [Butyrivibrio proteoclasticus]|uniref:family 43 glycosylhydrolase n=1 Tax=Butyrivibrio proteoclasticus TaxID=43305 RepID=UPI000B1AD110|nr:family 43 glycosylhydrolase [Butyrivibrio proteoclasticus]